MGCVSAVILHECVPRRSQRLAQASQFFLEATIVDSALYIQYFLSLLALEGGLALTKRTIDFRRRNVSGNRRLSEGVGTSDV